MEGEREQLEGKSKENTYYDADDNKISTVNYISVCIQTLYSNYTVIKGSMFSHNTFKR